MKTSFLPVFSATSGMHRVFGDTQQSTEIHSIENVLGPVLMTGNTPDGSVVTIRVRRWFRVGVWAKHVPEVINRFECYVDGILCDYTCERKLIVKTMRWLTERGQNHKEI